MNRSIKPLLLLILVFGPVFLAKAQRLTHVQGELLVRYRKNQTPAQMIDAYRSFKGRTTHIQKGRCLSKSQNIWTLEFDWTQIHETDFLDQIKNHPSVETAQLNHILQERAIPNDPFFDLQWFYSSLSPEGGDIGAELAWDITTGGVTASGDTIVVCVLDNGLEKTHEDIVGNLWINRAEIPNNGIDDDNNGYLDDYYGWNVEERNGNISSSNFHGTRVAGMIGAVGHNEIGVTGINWNVKLMIVRAYLGQIVESRIIEGYEYALQQRRRYNQTKGAEGAYVVATNSSWGYSGIMEEDYPIWCAIYDTLGQAGIINIAATENDNINVDVKGDLPTACSSPYLITVTSTDRSGAKLSQAGYGLTTIDLGAPGADIYTTFIGNTYNYDAGTSMAAPLVAGSVGLLYASPCPSLDLLSESDPGEAALLAKDILLRSTVPDSSLIGRSVTGGRLHVYNALQLLESECTDCFPPLSLRVEDRDQESITLSWIQASDVQRIDMRYRPTGTTDWIDLSDVGARITLDNLKGCTDYEVQFNAFCSETETGYGEIFIFKTDGCCEPPKNIQFGFIGQNEVLLNWEAVLAANNYVIRYRPYGETDWLEKTVIQTTTGLRNLLSCTEYEMQFRVGCSSGPSAFGSIIRFTTRGCGTCLEGDYCAANNLTPTNATLEWISEVSLGTMVRSSGAEGYGDFTVETGIVLDKTKTYDMTVTPEFSSIASNEYILAWIDFNQNGMFTSDEIIFDSEGTTQKALTRAVTIPETALLGSTRMRVVMQFRDKPGACSFSSGFFGEVEDYCVTIDDLTNTFLPQALDAEVTLIPNPARDQFQVGLQVNEAVNRMDLEVFDLRGRSVYRQGLGRVMEGTYTVLVPVSGWAAGIYLVRLQGQGKVITRRLVIFD